MKYAHVAVGGTWDHLHVGHKKIIDTSFRTSAKVSIGITSDDFAKKKPLSSSILPYSTRKKELETYLRSKKYSSRAKFYKLTDSYGPAVADKSLDSIVVTSNTLAGARKINMMRIKRGYTPLKIVRAPMVKSEGGQIISSELIRRGEIDRYGFAYKSLFKKTLFLPSSLRPKLQKPFGVLFKQFTGVGPVLSVRSSNSGPIRPIRPIPGKLSQNPLSKATLSVINYIKKTKSPFAVSVGDVINQELRKNKFVPHLSIIDLRSRRHPIQARIPKNAVSAASAPGTISTSLARQINFAVQKWLSGRRDQTIVVRGEEDLAVLPAVMLSPLYSLVVYGLADKGVVTVIVNEKTKLQASLLLSHFSLP